MLRGVAGIERGGRVMNADALIFQRFRGIYDTRLSQPHPQGLPVAFIKAPSADGLIRFHKEECVIRDEQNLDRFIARIPDKVMAFEPSPPPSSDPLLQRPAIEFDKHMVVAIISHEPNRFIDLNIVDVELTSKAMEVHCQYSEPGPAVPKVISYGAYCAVVTRRFDGEVVFVPYLQKT